MQHIYAYLGQALRHVVTKIRYVYMPSQALRHAATLAFLWQIKPLGLLQSITTTTGDRLFAECQVVCRVLFFGHSAKTPLPSVFF